MAELEKATVHGIFANYRTVQENVVTGETEAVVRTAYAGEEIEAPPAEIARLRNAGILDAPDAQAVAARALNPTDTVYEEPGPPVEPAPPSLGRAPAGQVLMREDTAGAGGVVPPDTDLSDPASVADWISAEKPNASQVVDAAGSDPARAEAILEGERIAQNGDPRKTVEEPLQRIIESGPGS